MKNKEKDIGKRVKDRENRQLLFLMIPGALLLLIFNYAPFLGIYMAFVDYKPNMGIYNSPFVGLKNFEFFFTSKDAVRIIRNTLGYNLIFLIVDLFFAVGVALMFYKLTSRKALKVYNTIILLPRFLSWVIVAFIAYVFLSPTHGLINSLITSLGGESVKWYTYPNPDKPEKFLCFSSIFDTMEKNWRKYTCYSQISTLTKYMVSLPVMTA